MLVPIDTSNKDNRKQIIAFYKEHYDAAEYLIPTIQKLETTDKQYFAYTNGIEVLGITSVRTPSKKLLELSSTVIHRDFRGKGIGTRINEKIENIAKTWGCTKITCNIYVDNLPNIKLKLNRGYLIEGLLRNHDDQGKHEYILGKEL